MYPSRSHRLEVKNIFFLCFDLSFIKFLVNTREKQELPGDDLWLTRYWLSH